MKNLICFFSAERTKLNHLQTILAGKFFQCFHDFCIIALTVSAHKKNSVCTYCKEDSVQKLETHLVHPLNVIKKQDDPVLFCNLPKQFQHRLFHNLVCQTTHLLFAL